MDAEGDGEVGLPCSGSDGDRLQHLRSVLPTEIRVTAETHPLFGRVVEAVSFKRVAGVVHLVVVLPDGSPGTIRADATGVFGESEEGGVSTVLTVEGIRRLREVTRMLVAEMPGRARKRK